MNIQAEPLDSSDYAKIFVENVHYDCQEEDIFNEFSKFGEIDSVIIPRDRTSKREKVLHMLNSQIMIAYS